MYIPFTVCYGPSIVFEDIPRQYRRAMYKNALSLLQEVCDENIWGKDLTNVGAKWFGSENFLYNQIDFLGKTINKIDHQKYEKDFDLSNTNQAPQWLLEEENYLQHIYNLMSWIDIDRLERRWTLKLKQNKIPYYSNADYFVSQLHYAALQLNVYTLTYGPELFTKNTIIRLIDSYDLYASPTSCFFTRNPLYHYYPNYLHYSGPTINFRVAPKSVVRDKIQQRLNQQRLNQENQANIDELVMTVRQLDLESVPVSEF